MNSQLPAGCRQILELQSGVITHGQAIGAGLSRHALAARLDSGRWQRLHAGVYAAFTGNPGPAPLRSSLEFGQSKPGTGGYRVPAATGCRGG